jgi:hypothetical protein
MGGPEWGAPGPAVEKRKRGHGRLLVGKTCVLGEERAWRGSSDFWSRAAWRMPAGFKSPDLVCLRIYTKTGQSEGWHVSQGDAAEPLGVYKECTGQFV